MSEEHNDNTKTHVVLSQGTMVSHYRVISRIGAGGMGEVYLAEDTKLNRKVALKFLSYQHSQNEELKTRFMREAQAVARLSHSNIVHIYEVGEYQGRPFFAMEHVEGQPLQKYISDEELSITETISIAIGICDGLNKAHQSGIVHRDIKTSNIVLDNDGHPKILDFGLATITGTEKITKEGSTIGTVAYMSPERVQGKKSDHRSDLFSLGVVLYELICKRTPFRKDSESATLNAIVNDNPEPMARYKSDVPEGLQRIVSKLLEKDPNFRYQSSTEVIADLSKEQQLLSSASFISSSQTTPGTRSQSSKTKLVLSGTSLLVIIVLLLVLKPWKVSISPTEEVTAAENLLAIMYFDNLVDPTDSLKLGEIATNLLITDLSESQYINVVSTQRLYDILKLLGHEGEKKVGREVATEVARKASSKWMLLGSILRTNPIILTSQLVDTETGNAIASQRIEGNQEDDIFSIIDSLTIEIKTDLSLPTAAIDEKDLPITGYTTSAEAYRYYLEGWEQAERYDFEGALEKFQKSAASDSTFAMAYFGLAWVDKEKNARKQAIERALSYMDKVNEYDRLAIKARKAELDGDFEQAIEELMKVISSDPYDKSTWNWLGLLYLGLPTGKEQAIECFKKTIEIDPLFKVGYNQLAYAYASSGDYDKSIWAINKYIEVAPDEPNPYDTRGDLYSIHGKLQEAKESYVQALKTDSMFEYSKVKLGRTYLFLGQSDSAHAIFQHILNKSKYRRERRQMRYALASVFAWQGKFKEALKVAYQGMSADELEGSQPHKAKYALCADILFELNNCDSAISTIEKGLEDSGPRGVGVDEKDKNLWYYSNLIDAYSRCGRVARAQELLNELSAIVPDDYERDAYCYAQAHVAEARGLLDSAVFYYEDCYDRVIDWWIHFNMGRAYFSNGQLGKSIEHLEMAANDYGPDRAEASVINVTVLYYLARAYEASGWTEKAIEQYEKFLEMWKNADPGLEKVEDAKERLARLKA